MPKNAYAKIKGKLADAQTKAYTKIKAKKGKY